MSLLDAYNQAGVVGVLLIVIAGMAWALWTLHKSERRTSDAMVRLATETIQATTEALTENAAAARALTEEVKRSTEASTELTQQIIELKASMGRPGR